MRSGCSWRLAANIISVIAAFYIIYLLGFQIQRDGLRCALYQSTRVLQSKNLIYWVDFGGLVGLVRERDMIWGEVDADISMLLPSRQRVDDPDIQSALLAADFPYLQDRGEWKMRFYRGESSIVDVDVWVANNDTQRIQMITGRLDPSIYNLPLNMMLPTRSYQVSSEPFVKCGAPADQLVSFQVPHRAEDYLSFWYGDYMLPRKNYKGPDKSRQWIEVFVWKNCMWVFDVYISFKVLARHAYYGLLYHSLSTVVTILGYVAAPIVAFLRARDRLRAYQQQWVHVWYLSVSLLYLTLVASFLRVYCYVGWALPNMSAICYGLAVLFLSQEIPRWGPVLRLTEPAAAAAATATASVGVYHLPTSLQQRVTSDSSKD